MSLSIPWSCAAPWSGQSPARICWPAPAACSPDQHAGTLTLTLPPVMSSHHEKRLFKLKEIKETHIQFYATKNVWTVYKSSIRRLFYPWIFSGAIFFNKLPSNLCLCFYFWKTAAAIYVYTKFYQECIILAQGNGHLLPRGRQLKITS